MYGELAPISDVELISPKIFFDGVEYQDVNFDEKTQTFTLTKTYMFQVAKSGTQVTTAAAPV